MHWGVNGFMKNALLMWKANSGTGKHHSQVDFENYEKLLLERLIPNSQPNSVVNDNTPYHNVLLERKSTSRSRGVDMMNWLSSHGIPCSDNMFKA
jgi:hypothetical protein